jgi:hypothetical protein
MEDKELDTKFFKSLNILLGEYIKPKSKDIEEEIYKTVKNICKSNGYWWGDIKYNFDGKDYFWLRNDNDKNEIIYLKKQLEYYKSLSEI